MNNELESKDIPTSSNLYFKLAPPPPPNSSFTHNHFLISHLTIYAAEEVLLQKTSKQKQAFSLLQPFQQMLKPTHCTVPVNPRAFITVLCD
jgi:hypothetical protein